MKKCFRNMLKKLRLKCDTVADIDGEKSSCQTSHDFFYTYVKHKRWKQEKKTIKMVKRFKNVMIASFD